MNKSYWIISLAVVICLGSSYSLGYSSGSNDKQLEWNEDIKSYEKKVKDLTKQLENQEKEYRAENTRILLELNNAKKEYEKSIAVLDANYSDRLRESEARAKIYESQARAGNSQCRNLASHATKLDKCLTEGRELVKELSRTIELRDSQLRLLGEQITNERELIK